MECGHCNRKGHIRKDCPHKDKPWTEIAPTSGEKDKKKHWSGRNKKLQPVTYCKTCKRWRFDDSGGHLPGAAHDKFVKKSKDKSATASTTPAASSGSNRIGRRNGGRRVTFAQVAEADQEEEDEESVYSDSEESQSDESDSEDFCNLAVAAWDI